MSKTKAQRIEALHRLLCERQAADQDTLMGWMKAAGHDLTQATLSRDLKTLGATKRVVNGQYRYALPAANERIEVRDEGGENGFVELRFSRPMAVVKTRPGYASRIAYQIDEQANDVVIGTVAGEDTILLVTPEGTTEAAVRAALGRFIEQLR